MFEPGQKVIITESNFTKKTGPKVGSMGFVSGMDFYHCGIRFDKVIWFRYGFGKSRIETHPFFLVPSKEEAQVFRARAWGKVEPVHDRQNINAMTDTEFVCWMHSMFRILVGNSKANNIRAKAGLKRWHLRPGRFLWNREYDRTYYADLARQMKSIYFKDMEKALNNYYEQARINIGRTYDKHSGMQPDVMAEHIVRGNRYNYDTFFTLFYMATCLNFVGPKYLDLISTNEYLSTIYRVWKQQVKIFN